MVQKISSLDIGYNLGDLSLFPETYDDKSDLYVATNNAETTLKQTLPFMGQKIIVNDASKFPEQGILRVGTLPGKMGSHELIYYSQRTDTVFYGLIRGYLGTKQTRWENNSPITSGVMAEHNNALRDAVYKIETDLGVEVSPATDSLNDLLKKLEEKWLAPRPLFRVTPTPIGPAPLTVAFKNFTLGHAIRFLWDFGDGTTSTEKNPVHIYRREGQYTVKLDVITESGGAGVQNKYDYITVDNEQVTPFFYAIADDSTPGPLTSVETAAKTFISPSKINFIDQTDGKILQRFWVWDDEESVQILNPNIHTASHVYQKPGEYNPSMLVVFSSSLLKRGFLQKTLIVL